MQLTLFFIEPLSWSAFDGGQIAATTADRRTSDTVGDVVPIPQ
jgi:hypothetical protein